MRIRNLLMMSAAVCFADDGSDGPAGGFVPLAPAGAQSGATTSENTDPNAPFAEVDGQSFKTADELAAYVAQKTGDTTHPLYKAPTEEGTEETPEAKAAREAKEAEEGDDKAPKDDKPKASDGKPSWVQPDITDEVLRENLTKAGGFYAEEEYFPLAAEFERTGTVSEEALKAYAEKKSLPLDMVKEFVEGAKSRRELEVERSSSATVAAQAKVEETVQSVYKAVGGEDHYKALAEWSAKGGITEAESTAYSKALDTDPAAALVMLEAFNARFRAEGGGKPARDITLGAGDGGKGQGPEASKGYASRAEEQADMNNPKYKSDPAFRKMVQDRIQATTAY